MRQKERIELSLFLLRLSVFLVMLFWTLDKFIQPEHASRVFQNFYGIGLSNNVIFYVIGALELLLLVAFVTGSWKRISYGLVLLFHAVSTLSSYKQYFDPFNNLLFFAAWPMLAACVTLYLLRDSDTRLTSSWGNKRL